MINVILTRLRGVDALNTMEILSIIGHLKAVSPCVRSTDTNTNFISMN